MNIRMARLVGAVAMSSMVLAACGSSSKTTTSPTSPTTTAGTSPSVSSSAGAVNIGTEQSKYGAILEANGKTLYALSADTSTTSKCSTACAAVWPPLTVSAVPSFAAGVKQSLFGHLSRSDGSQQLTYGGHPLYWFAHDKASGQTNGEGVTAFGGTWDVVAAASGQPVTAAASSSGY
ncbi:MAG: COG4315 family predicted lipoprotein [Acidimicrobiales bacterium]